MGGSGRRFVSGLKHCLTEACGEDERDACLKMEVPDQSAYYSVSMVTTTLSTFHFVNCLPSVSRVSRGNAIESRQSS